MAHVLTQGSQPADKHVGCCRLVAQWHSPRRKPAQPGSTRIGPSALVRPRFSTASRIICSMVLDSLKLIGFFLPADSRLIQTSGYAGALNFLKQSSAPAQVHPVGLQ